MSSRTSRGPALIADLAFGACYLYSPHGRGSIASGSRLLRVRLKTADPRWLPQYAARVRALAARSGRYPGFFGPQVVIVPVPGSQPQAQGRPWVAECIAAEFLRQGLAGRMWSGLRRIRPVRKSATAPQGRRPSVREHCQTLTAESCAEQFPLLLLVDDIVSKGRTLLAAADTLRQAFPASDIRAFAVARTMSLVDRIEHLVAPCEGHIRWDGSDAVREP